MSDLPTKELLSIKREIEKAIGRSVTSITASDVDGETVINITVNFSSVAKPFPTYVHDHRVVFEDVTSVRFN